jgi:hypothetical protein
MKLVKNLKQQPRQLPNKLGGSSGYLLLAVVEDGTDLYAAFIDQAQEQLWIEKYIAPIIKREFFCFEDLTKIKDEQEFVTVRNFLMRQNII